MDWLRRMARTRTAADVLLWVAITLPVLLTGELPGGSQQGGLPMSWVMSAAVPLLGLAVLLSRSRPVLGAAIPAGLALLATPELFTNNFPVAQVVLAYLLGRRTDSARGALVLFCGVCAIGMLLVVFRPGVSMWSWFTLVMTVLFTMVLPWLLGRYRRQYAELVRTGWELADRLEREQALVADRTRLRERSRIAGDMHDSLGHELSLIALRAGALQVSPGLGTAEREAAAELRASAATATERLREIIGVLREDSESAPVLPADDTVEALVDRAADSGMAVRLLREGDGDALPPMADRAVYRVVQEALTNATKHAPGAAVTVRLSRSGASASVEVVNEAPPAGPLPLPGGGHGLVGLDERVRLAGGILRTQPVDGGFAVHATVPLAPGAAATPPGEGISQRELALARRKVRRGMLDAIWVPVVIAVVLGLLMLGFNLYTSYRSVLDPEDYERLRIGQTESAVEHRLPAYEANEEQRPTSAPADPPGTDSCRFYRTRPFTISPAYRLCFTDGRLSHKDEVDVTP